MMAVSLVVWVLVSAGVFFGCRWAEVIQQRRHLQRFWASWDDAGPWYDDPDGGGRPHTAERPSWEQWT